MALTLINPDVQRVNFHCGDFDNLRRTPFAAVAQQAGKLMLLVVATGR
jgi:hypothetical protein